jgi:radical SAM superfamily enzyme YgiQ (UPF0313 family)
MATNSLLVNYVGYPLIISSLIPDDGTASLAACLKAEGHETKIFDYSTVDTIERLFPYQYKEQLEEIIGKITKDLESSITPDQELMNNFYSLDSKITAFHKEKTKEIASEIYDYTRKNDIDFIGFKLWLGEGFAGSMEIAKELKKQNPKLKIFAGGPQVDWFHELIFEITDSFDAIAYGEGEETIVQLAEYVEGKKKIEKIPNLIFKRNGNITTTPMKRIENMNELPFPLYDSETYPAIRDDNKIKIILLDESRGCPNSCNFCIHPIKSGRKWRTKTPKRIADEMEDIIKKYGTNVFRFAGSNTPPFLHKNTAEEILQRNLKVTYSGFGHVGGMHNENYETLKKSGCHALFYGVESGSQFILENSINKKSGGKFITSGEIIEAIKKCREANLYSVASLIYPAPLETEQTRQESLETLVKANPDSAIVSLPGVVIGTEWERNHKKYQIELLRPESLGKDLMCYKPKFTYPPILYEPLPYSLNGKSFLEYVRDSTEFTIALEKAGILTQMTDEMLVMAHYSGMPAREFRNKNRHYISVGDHKNLRELLISINSSMSNFN